MKLWFQFVFLLLVMLALAHVQEPKFISRFAADWEIGDTGCFGATIEVTAPDGRGMVYDANGKFLFFKE